MFLHSLFTIFYSTYQNYVRLWTNNLITYQKLWVSYLHRVHDNPLKISYVAKVYYVNFVWYFMFWREPI